MVYESCTSRRSLVIITLSKSVGASSSATVTDVGGKLSMDVNVTSIPINYTDDSVQVKGPTGNSIAPSSSGAVGSYLDGMLEKIIMKAIGRLSFNSINQLRAEVQLINVPSQVSAGNVSTLTGSLAINGTSQLATQQTFQQSFRRNLNVT